eukprot:CAMPEP_0172490908 /NCGR_PEP_ID=MMETSP1066-20121228/21527_1 /TAXON_ID=671091 /ORGANISM="Coscinodiscus wailesii, Strain CCMP2513" /LENGTH=294 /DNA_ID=CAMNT_0013259633 /DNA_START=58 /DNA_END=942 /DNA_ORIENTATION=+
MKFSSTILGLCTCGASAFTHPPLTRTFQVQSGLSSVPGNQAYSFSPVQSSGEKDNSPGPLGRGRSVWDELTPITVQGGALRTWSLADPYVEKVQVFMRTDGRPLNANVELWQGPDNTPQKMSVYLEDGDMRPFNAVIETPSDGSNTVAIRNTHSIEFPLSACVEAEVDNAIANGMLSNTGETKLVQGGAIFTTPFSPSVGSVQVILTTDGRPLNARVELLQGPNNNKQVIEFYSEDGQIRPLNVVFETPGVGNVVRICNTATVEFPLTASVTPVMVDEFISDGMGSRNNAFIMS